MLPSLCLRGQLQKSVALNASTMPRARMRSRNLLPLQSIAAPIEAAFVVKVMSTNGRRPNSRHIRGWSRTERNPASPAWARRDDAWLHVVAHARGILAAERQSRAGVRHERVAAREVVTLGDAVPAHETRHATTRRGCRRPAVIDFPASEVAGITPLGDPDLGVFRALIPSFKVGRKLA
jgi:hypothetical protein